MRRWGTARDQVDGFGNAVSPQVGTWIGTRLRAVLHSPQDCGSGLEMAAWPRPQGRPWLIEAATGGRTAPSHTDTEENP